MRAVLIPADVSRRVRLVWLPPYEDAARWRVRRLVGVEPSATIRRPTVGADRCAPVVLFSSPAATASNARAELLTDTPVRGDAVLAVVVRVPWLGDQLAHMSRGIAALLVERLNGRDEIELTDSHAIL